MGASNVPGHHRGDELSADQQRELIDTPKSTSTDDTPSADTFVDEGTTAEDQAAFEDLAVAEATARRRIRIALAILAVIGLAVVLVLVSHHYGIYYFEQPPK